MSENDPFSKVSHSHSHNDKHCGLVQCCSTPKQPVAMNSKPHTRHILPALGSSRRKPRLQQTRDFSVAQSAAGSSLEGLGPRRFHSTRKLRGRGEKGVTNVLRSCADSSCCGSEQPYCGQGANCICDWPGKSFPAKGYKGDYKPFVVLAAV